MTARLVLGIDLGVSGAIAALADGRFVGVWDLPMRPRKTGHQELNGYEFGDLLRVQLAAHDGAEVTAVMEAVSGYAPKGQGKSLVCMRCHQPSGHVEERSMGATSIFQFGRGAGGVQYALEVYKVGIVLVSPAKWKNETGLPGGRENKHYSRTAAAQCYPAAADQLKLVKHDGRAEAILLARWFECHQRVGATAADLGSTAPKFELTPEARA